MNFVGIVAGREARIHRSTLRKRQASLHGAAVPSVTVVQFGLEGVLGGLARLGVSVAHDIDEGRGVSSYFKAGS